MKTKFKQEEGVAGLTIFLTLITFLFVIGLLIMIFSLMGGELEQTDSILASESATIGDADITVNDGTTGSLTTCASKPNGAVTSVTHAYNKSNNVLIASPNYTTSGCVITLASTSAGDIAKFNNTVWNVTYTYSFSGTGYDVMNDSISGITGATDWYDIFIVIGAMVVLILLTVIIITAIRGSGLMVGGSTGGDNRNVGSA